MAGSRQSRLRLFGMAFLAGAGFRLGIPGLADVIEGIWGQAESASRSALPAGLQGLIGVISLLVLGIVLYLNYDIFFRGAKKGRKGLMMVIYGFVAGIVIVSTCLAGLSI